MIPSTTKLALLSGIVLIFGEIVYSLPLRYDLRQDGGTNVVAKVEDFLFIIIPSKESVNAALNVFNLNTRGNSEPNYDEIPSRTASKLGFAPAEKSPYKVDLEKSSVPLGKVQTPVIELVEIKSQQKESSEVKKSAEAKTVKKELKMEKEEKLSKNERDKAT